MGIFDDITKNCKQPEWLGKTAKFKHANQPERSKREDSQTCTHCFINKCIENIDGKVCPSCGIAVRCGALNIAEMQ